MRFIIEAVKARGGDTEDRPALAGAIEKVAYTGPRGPMSGAPAFGKLSLTMRDNGVLRPFLRNLGEGHDR